MTPTQKEVYKNKAIKELKRVAKLFPHVMRKSDYNEKANKTYSTDKILYRLGLRFNALKKEAGMPTNKPSRGIGTKGGYKKKPLFTGKTTSRNCNMRDEQHGGKDFWFEAEGSYHSCPSCTKVKQNSSYHSGMDV